MLDHLCLQAVEHRLECRPGRIQFLDGDDQFLDGTFLVDQGGCDGIPWEHVHSYGRVHHSLFGNLMTHQLNGPFSKPLITLIRFEPMKTGR